MKIILFGARGQVGAEFCAFSEREGISLAPYGHAEADISNVGQVEAAFQSAGSPDVAINAAAYTAVDRAEEEARIAHLVNADGAGIVAAAAAKRDIPVIHVSTDYVFNGQRPAPYLEDDAAEPINIYGASKLAGEQAVRRANPRHVIVRTSWVFGVHGANFVKTMLRLADMKPEFGVVDDQHGCPTAAADIADMLLAVAQKSNLEKVGSDRWGTYHFCGRPNTTWHGFADQIFEQKATRPKINAIATSDYPTAAQRPARTVLDCGKIERVFGIKQPDWRVSLRRVLEDLGHG